MMHPLKIWLKSKTLTQKSFAEGINLSDQTLRRVISGSHETTTGMLRRISEGTDFEVSEAELFTAYLKARREFRSKARSIKTTDMAVSCEERP